MFRRHEMYLFLNVKYVYKCFNNIIMWMFKRIIILMPSSFLLIGNDDVVFFVVYNNIIFGFRTLLTFIQTFLRVIKYFDRIEFDNMVNKTLVLTLFRSLFCHLFFIFKKLHIWLTVYYVPSIQWGYIVFSSVDCLPVHPSIRHAFVSALYFLNP